MTDNTDVSQLFVRLRYAAWAGDIKHCHELFHRLEAQSGRGEPLTYPTAILAQRAGLLLERLQRIESEIDEQQRLVATNHLRGVIWRIESHEFQLRAYLDDFSWEVEMFRRIAAIKIREGTDQFELEEVRDELKEYLSPEQSDGKLSAEFGREIVTSRGARWVIGGNEFFRDVKVSDIGLILVKGIWTQRLPPDSLQSIKSGFIEVLDQIETQTPVSDLELSHRGQ
jgi:hypothetical protein